MLALRPGTQHSASETEYNIERVLPMAVRLTSSRSGAGETASPLLFRADSGFDSAKLMCAIGQQALALKREIAFIIKWNPRSTPVETIAKNRAADTSTTWTQVSAGKRQCLWADGVQLPEYVLEGWSTTLPNAFTPVQEACKRVLFCGLWRACRAGQMTNGWAN